MPRKTKAKRTEDDWNVWSNFVLNELERVSNCYKELEERVTKLQIQRAVDALKVAIITAIGSAVLTIAAYTAARAIFGK